MIPRRRITFGQMLPWLLAFVCACGWVLVTLGFWEQRAAARHIGATSSFYHALLRHSGCVTRSAVIAVAEEQGQRWQDVERPLSGFFDADIVEAWLAVKIQPEFLVSKHDEGRYFFGVESNGCVRFH